MGLFRKTEAVSPTSPAALLAKSLTDPQTRDEWVRTSDFKYGGCITRYRNRGRDIELARTFVFSMRSSSVRMSTPFALNQAEERMVRDALRAFDKHLSDEREQAALARLIAPKKAKGK